MSRRVTIKSIAEDLGISHMTVSRALSGHPNVQQSTRDAVVRRAEELGYVRSAAASAMRGDPSSIVGLLIPNITNDFYARFANTLAETCEAHGLQLIIHLTKDDYEAERLATLRLREVQARTVVSVPTPLPGTLPTAPESGLDTVQLIRDRPGADPAASVLVDDARALRDAVLHLHRQGHRRIAYLGAPETLSSGRQRLAAYRAGMRDAGLDPDPVLTLLEPPSIAMGDRLTCRLIDHTDASAVLCGGFEISNGALKAAMQREALGSRLAFVGYGDPEFYSWIRGGLTTIEVPVDELAIRTVDVITQPESAPRGQRHSFAAKLKVRG
ncbi:LacI family DNA-binding transcriptional regulator [Sulfitobacter sp. D35]|uniref:LacI family DNA-binding transcriptional regulator n=1 Tax=Sulfitobacter sp. D35 TaxID=3083252 RepID=UPI00296FE00C|nr:LacI family DNA-binding transcriptional regulator [Sulfitobacter sp. D35]MDW4499733.1 LacI family DNA-binding transcriptional regulator [Sulfitobacter sp. D35]